MKYWRDYTLNSLDFIENLLLTFATRFRHNYMVYSESKNIIPIKGEEMIRKKSGALVLSVLLLGGSGAAYADFVDGIVGGVVGGVVGSVITNEVYRHNSSQQVRSPRRVQQQRVVHRKKTVKKKTVKKKTVKKKSPYKTPAPVMTPEKKIQKALAALGFYKGSIDGEINTYETRSAIKAMNNAYERGNTATLDPKAKETLIYLGDLFILDRYLAASGNDKITKNKRLQAALKVLGVYHDKIDGAVGPATRRAIEEYTGGSSTLDFESEYRLIESAKMKNDRNIEDMINSLKEGNISKSMYRQSPGKPVVLQPAN